MEHVMRRWFPFVAAAVLLVASSRTSIAALKLTPGLVSIRFVEVTGSPTSYTFGANSAQLLNQLPGALGVGNNDFTGLSTEFYDVFYSTASGTPDPNGDYVSIECRFDNNSGGGGCNISEAYLVFSDHESCACAVASAVYLGTNSVAGSAGFAADCAPATLSTMGNTVGTTARMRITLDYGCVPTAARSNTWGRIKTIYR